MPHGRGPVGVAGDGRVGKVYTVSVPVWVVGEAELDDVRRIRRRVRGGGQTCPAHREGRRIKAAQVLLAFVRTGLVDFAERLGQEVRGVGSRASDGLGLPMKKRGAPLGTGCALATSSPTVIVLERIGTAIDTTAARQWCDGPWSSRLLVLTRTARSAVVRCRRLTAAGRSQSH
jgi:hypothetical protein